MDIGNSKNYLGINRENSLRYFWEKVCLDHMHSMFDFVFATTSNIALGQTVPKTISHTHALYCAALLTCAALQATDAPY